MEDGRNEREREKKISNFPLITSRSINNFLFLTGLFASQSKARCFKAKNNNPNRLAKLIYLKEQLKVLMHDAILLISLGTKKHKLHKKLI